MMDGWRNCLALSALVFVAGCAEGSGGKDDRVESQSSQGAALTILERASLKEGEIPPGAKRIVEEVREEPTTARVEIRRMRPELKAAARLSADAPAVSMNLFGMDLLLKKLSARPNGAGATEWYGRVESVDGTPGGGSAVLTFDEAGLTGTVYLDARELNLYSITPDFVIVREMAPGAFPPDHRPGFVDPISGQQGARDEQSLETNAAPADVSALVSVSPAAEKKIAELGYPTLRAFTDAALAKANLSYVNSNINVRLSYAGPFVLANYKETNAWDADRDAFFANAAAAAERKRRKADTSMLIFTNEQYCGEVKDVDAGPATALGVVAVTCAIGQLSFAHEVGHLFGACHDNEPAPSYPYGRGFVHVDAKDPKKSWRTVMAYPGACDGCTRVPYWSSPAVSYPSSDGDPMGTATRDNARVLRERATALAKFGDQI